MHEVEEATVHPHACGEHQIPTKSRFQSAGSSPRLWGTPSRNDIDYFPVGSSPRLWGTHLGDHHASAKLRFIPTPVGNTSPSRLHHSSIPVHPHACGEHAHSKAVSKCLPGSSPRLWGTQEASCSREGNRRFIPTPVGNTTGSRSRGACLPVHPHACGEHTSSISWKSYSIFNERTSTENKYHKFNYLVRHGYHSPARTKPI